MKKKITLIFFLIISIYAYSQSSFDFEGKYQYARSLSSKNPDSSEIVLSQIIDFAQKENHPDYLAKAYYLKSFNSYLKSDAKNCLDFAEKALHISEKYNYAIGKALAYRMQGTQYAKLGLLKESAKNLNNAIAEVKNNNTDEGHELRGMIYNSFLILLDQKEYKKKEYYSRNAIREFQKINNISRRNELLVSAYTNMGYNLAEIKKFDESKSFFQKALALVGNENYYLKCSILHDIGFSFSEQNKSDSAIVYYHKALKIARQYGFNEKRIEITTNLERTYAKLNDFNNVQKYKLEHLNLKDSVSHNQKMAVNQTLSNKEKAFKEKINKTETKSNILVIACSTLAFILAIIFIKSFKFRKKQKEIVAKIDQGGIAVSHEEDPQKTKEEPSRSDDDENPSKEKIKISPEVEEKILNGLKDFEKNLRFNDKNISHYNLSTELNVNTKYLSAIIRKHKNFNFNQYINHLRISYIVDKLKNEPQYRKYKINYLAEITGYSSHSAFSLEFKKIVGMRPSAFIKTLDEIS